MNIVLLEPEIPQNTGNIGRTCMVTGSRLHLIEPLGFLLTEKSLKRAGMDYWHQLDVTRYLNFDDFMERNPEVPLYFATTKARQLYTDVSYEADAYLVFGKESAGIPEEILMQYPKRCVRIPMIGESRSLNLSNSVAVLLYEALRQHGFEGMKLQGELHRHRW
ncbi:MAG: tRNA (cytidine(34)-2'-O)-methyltransferase [Lachnospiraceae bacterium]|nr:tRNA (cytidine(34)-2'-O)-methyltransferase [Lachnospiraceae bacterium]